MAQEHRCEFCDHVFVGRRRRFCFDCLPDHGDVHPKTYAATYQRLLNGVSGGGTSSRIPKGHPARPEGMRPKRACVGCGEDHCGRGNFCSDDCRRLHAKRARSERRASGQSAPALAPTIVAFEKVEYTRRQLSMLIMRSWPDGECNSCGGPLQPWWDHCPDLGWSRKRCYPCYLEHIARLRKPKPAVVRCVACGVEFRKAGNFRTCGSAECKQSVLRDKDRRHNLKRRAARAGVAYSLFGVWESSGGCCHLCGLPVDIKLSGNDALGPTVDHVVPISLNGKDCATNVRIAHRECNVKRGVKPLEVSA